MFLQIFLGATTSLACAYETALNARKCLETFSKVNSAPTAASSSKEKLFRTVKIWVKRRFNGFKSCI